MLRNNRGGEYLPNEFTIFYEIHGTKHEVNALYSPQWNGLVERMNIILCEMINPLLISYDLPWREAFLSACYILNRISYKKSNITPYEL